MKPLLILIIGDSRPRPPLRGPGAAAIAAAVAELNKVAAQRLDPLPHFDIDIPGMIAKYDATSLLPVETTPNRAQRRARQRGKGSTRAQQRNGRRR